MRTFILSIHSHYNGKGIALSSTKWTWTMDDMDEQPWTMDDMDEQPWTSEHGRAAMD